VIAWIDHDAALLGGLLVALLSAAAINFGFLLQHHGLREAAAAGAGPLALLRASLRSRTWLAGQAIGIAGFGAQILAVAIAPLSLVQAFAAGGLALSVPLAARLFDHPIDRRQALGVVVMAAGLASLPLGLGHLSDRLHATAMAIVLVAATALAGAAATRQEAWLRAISAGLFYGVADAAIKAVSVGWARHGLISGWTVVALVTTLAGFVSFQSALRAGDAVTAISLVNALAALVALAAGLGAFGETFGHGPATVAGHLVAIAAVLACVPLLAAAQSEIVTAREERTAHQTARNGAGEPEQHPFEPWAGARRAAPQDLAELVVARNRERHLRDQQQHRDADDGSDR